MTEISLTQKRHDSAPRTKKSDQNSQNQSSKSNIKELSKTNERKISGLKDAYEFTMVYWKSIYVFNTITIKVLWTTIIVHCFLSCSSLFIQNAQLFNLGFLGSRLPRLHNYRSRWRHIYRKLCSSYLPKRPHRYSWNCWNPHAIIGGQPEQRTGPLGRGKIAGVSSS